jgi:hypothetical protein
LRLIFAGDWEIFAPITLGLIYFAALTNRYTVKRFPKINQLPKANRVFGWTLIVIGVFFALGIARDPIAAGSNTLLTMRGLLGVVDLFWLWLGAGLFQGAIGWANGSQRKRRVLLGARDAWGPWCGSA